MNNGTRDLSVFFATCPDDVNRDLCKNAASYLAGRELRKNLALRRAYDRGMNVYSRILLRWIIGDSLGIPASGVDWEYDGWGRPFLPGMPSFDFSFAHSGSCLAAAVSRDLRVGIDIERPYGDSDFSETARLYFSRSEYLWISTADEDTCRSRFLESWCRKEAYGKKIGTGRSESILKTPLGGGGDSPNDDPSGEREANFISGRYNGSTWAVCWSGRREPSVSFREISLSADENGYAVKTVHSCEDVPPA